MWIEAVFVTAFGDIVGVGGAWYEEAAPLIGGDGSIDGELLADLGARAGIADLKGLNCILRRKV